MVEQKDPDFTSSHMDPQITTICRRKSMKKTGTYPKSSSTNKDMNKEPQSNG